MLLTSFCLCRNVAASCSLLARTSLSSSLPLHSSSLQKRLISTDFKKVSSELFKKIFQKPEVFNGLKFSVRDSNLYKIPTAKQFQTQEVYFQSRKKAVGYWLLGCSGMVFVAVALGGITRLTESGLSMVHWKVLGEGIPACQEAWKREFEKYKQYPEYKLLKSDLTLEEFKWIWYMEFAHRTWGRCIGAAFAVPAGFFWLKGYLTPIMKKRVIAFGALIAAQGLMGWYMVKSGLEDRFQDPNDVPRVSQYRLAAHLGLALTLYTAFLWSALDNLLKPQTVAKITAATKKFRILAHSSKGMIFLTALSGAFVAGLDAGLVYNSFPKMGDNWIPEDIMAISPILKNFTENPTTVQFDHRILGTATLALITTMWFLSRRLPLPPRAKTAANAVAAMAWFQVILGITTLVHYVPIPLAASHQSGSLVLLTFAIWLTHELKLLKYVPK